MRGVDRKICLISQEMFKPGFLSGCMCLVELPAKLYEHQGQVDYSAAETIQNKLFLSYQIEVNNFISFIISLVILVLRIVVNVNLIKVRQ